MKINWDKVKVVLQAIKGWLIANWKGFVVGLIVGRILTKIFH